jgi:hypothetical protein
MGLCSPRRLPASLGVVVRTARESDRVPEGVKLRFQEYVGVAIEGFDQRLRDGRSSRSMGTPLSKYRW